MQYCPVCLQVLPNTGIFLLVALNSNVNPIFADSLMRHCHQRLKLPVISSTILGSPGPSTAGLPSPTPTLSIVPEITVTTVTVGLLDAYLRAHRKYPPSLEFPPIIFPPSLWNRASFIGHSFVLLST